MGTPRTSARMGKSAFAVLVCAGVISLVSPSAESQGVSIRVSPASITATVRNGDSIGPLLVTNRGTFPVEVRGTCEVGGHDQSGVPMHREVRDPAATDAYVTLDPVEFRLPPGGSRLVYAQVHLRSGFSGGAYPVILFRARRAEGLAQGGIIAASQIAVLTLLTVAPGGAAVPPEAEAVLTSLTVEGNADGSWIRVTAACENRGAIHTSLSGLLLIRDCDGRVAAQGALASATCLPGCARVLSGLVDAARLRKGTYIAEVRLATAGRAADSALIAFKVEHGVSVASTHIELRRSPAASHGSERSMAPRIARLAVPVVSEGRGLPLEVVLESPSGVLLDPLGYVEIWDYQMKRVGVVALQGTGPAPGGHTVVRLTWPEILSPGYYTARATLQWGGEGLSVSTPFVVGSGVSLGSKG
ncbi:MAG: hypothetical protein ACM3ZO_08025 [Clostridia bacterium]